MAIEDEHTAAGAREVMRGDQRVDAGVEDEG